MELDEHQVQFGSPISNGKKLLKRNAKSAIGNSRGKVGRQRGIKFISEDFSTQDKFAKFRNINK